MNQMDLKGRVAIVTGGAQGIGLAIAQRMLDSGARVALWDLDAPRVTEAADALCQASGAGRALAVPVELSDEAAVVQALTATLAHFGQVDILVNNAGIAGGNAPLWELDPQVWRNVIEVNLIAPYLVCRHVVPHMRSRGYGRIVNIASVAGKEGNPNASHYSASKAGLIALTKSLAKELATQNSLVNVVTPAVARSAILAQQSEAHIAYMLSKIPMGRLLEPEEVASMVTWLASEECSFTTGAVFDITGGRSTY